jgi:hypothetical protein
MLMVVGIFALIGSMAGFFMLSKGAPRSLLVGMWTGYFVYGLVFTYTIHTHDYWNLMLVPIVALSLGPGADKLFGLLSRKDAVSHLIRYGSVAAVVSMAFVILICFQAWARKDGFSGLKHRLKAVVPVIGISRWTGSFITSDYGKQIRTYRRIGDLVNHSTRTVFLSDYYGKPLRYHGEICGFPWPQTTDLQASKLQKLPELTVEERLTMITKRNGCEYFIVTERMEFERQPALKALLTEAYPLFAEGTDFLIFDLRTPVSNAMAAAH